MIWLIGTTFSQINLIQIKFQFHIIKDLICCVTYNTRLTDMTSVTKEIILMSPLVIALTLLTLLTLILTTKRGFLLDIFECGIVCYFPFYWNPIDYSLFQRRFSENKAIFSSSQKADRAWKFKIDWKRIHNARYTASKKSYIANSIGF